jgi:hypothetical protein
LQASVVLIINVWATKLNVEIFQGDPFDTSVLLWTRAVPVSPANSSELPDQSMPACVSFKISTSESLSGEPVDTGTAFTSYDIDWTAKLEAKGLEPDTKYFFQFSKCANPLTVSPIGSAGTLASPDSEFCGTLLFHVTDPAMHHSAPAGQVNNGSTSSFRYNPSTGEGAIGVEFAGTAVTSTSSFGSGITPAAADVKSRTLVAVNADLQWSEGSFRGFFTLTIDSNTLNATYYAMRNTSSYQ